MTNVLIILFSYLFSFSVFGEKGADSKEKYDPNWDSLAQWETPEWYMDAKFGIYVHWGPITEACREYDGNAGWTYPLYMYDKTAFCEKRSRDDFWTFHREHFGDQSEVGYKDIIPRFKAAEFDSEYWMELFSEAGARLAGLVGIHADNFAMWDSEVHAWNAMDMGPKRDVAGELENACRKRGMKFYVSFNDMFGQSYRHAELFDNRNGEYSTLYSSITTYDSDGKRSPNMDYQRMWRERFTEFVHKYNPDLITFDGGRVEDEVRIGAIADYYNYAEKRGQKVAVTGKIPALFDNYRGSIEEMEWATSPSLRKEFFQSLMPVGPWFHRLYKGEYNSSRKILRGLIDTVSKNGFFMLNVDPDADGRIPPIIENRLRDIGAWMKINGEAIYGTRPWKVYGEVPVASGLTKSVKNKHGNLSYGDINFGDNNFSSQDVRFTTKSNTLYAIVMGKPADNSSVLIKKLASGNEVVKSVSILGLDVEPEWEQGDQGLHVMIPVAELPFQFAWTLKIGLSN